jgi:hypothetical protein
MNQPALQFPNLFLATSDADDSRNEKVVVVDSMDEDPKSSPRGTASTTTRETIGEVTTHNPREYVDQTIIPHRLQMGLGIHQGAHGSLYKCHTLYLEYKSLLAQLQLQSPPPPATDQNNDNDDDIKLQRQLLQQTQRQLMTELQLQQMEFQKFIYIQQQQQSPLRNEIVPNLRDTNPTTLTSSALPSLRQRFHQVQQLHSCYQEYNAIVQVLYHGNSTATATSTTNTLLPPPPSTTTTATTLVPPHRPHTNDHCSNEALQTTYATLLHDKQCLLDQISNVQQQEIQLRKQQLHLLQQTIQDMKYTHAEQNK